MTIELREARLTLHGERNNLPTGRRYVYRGDGHDAIDPAECECGKCGWIRRRSGNPNPKNPRKGKA